MSTSLGLRFINILSDNNCMITLALTDGLARIFASLIAGVLIGFTRKGYPAGMRTFALICIGSTIFTIISIDPSLSGAASYDPTRIISQIVTGIGFIGAGVIWKSNIKVGGLTTAAAIWTTAAVGILIGLGEIILSLFSLVLIMLVLFSKKYLPEGQTDHHW